MKLHIAIIAIMLCFYAKSETLILFYGNAINQNYLLTRDYEITTNKICHEVILADAISIKAVDFGSQITFSNVVVFRSVVLQRHVVGKKSEDADGQYSMKFREIQMGFPPQTELLFNGHLSLLKEVKSEDVRLPLKSKLGTPVKN